MKEAIERTLEVVVLTLMTALAVVVVLGVGFRKFGAALVWYDEVASVLVVVHRAAADTWDLAVVSVSAGLEYHPQHAAPPHGSPFASPDWVDDCFHGHPPNESG